MKKTKKYTSQQKKEGLLIAALSLIAVFMLVFCFNAAKADEHSAPQMAGTTTTSAPTTTTTQPPQTTTVPPATQTTSSAQTTAPTEAPTETTTAAVVDEKEEILKVVADGVNALKASDASFKGHKVQNINIQLVDSSVPYMNDFVNSIIKAFVKEEIFDYDFTNGVADDPESDGTVDTINTFPPGDKPFELTKEGVASATKTVDGENTVLIVPEKSTLENPRPPHHNAGADTLDLSSVEIPIVTITKVDFDYPGAEISVTVNPEGEVVGYHEHLKISGTGEASGLGISGYGTIEGYIDEKWDIDWK